MALGICCPTHPTKSSLGSMGTTGSFSFFSFFSAGASPLASAVSPFSAGLGSSGAGSTAGTVAAGTTGCSTSVDMITLIDRFNDGRNFPNCSKTEK